MYYHLYIHNDSYYNYYLGTNTCTSIRVNFLITSLILNEKY